MQLFLQCFKNTVWIGVTAGDGEGKGADKEKYAQR